MFLFMYYNRVIPSIRSSKQDGSVSLGMWHGWATPKTHSEPYIRQLAGRPRTGDAAQDVHVTPGFSNPGSRPPSTQPRTQLSMATCPGQRTMIEATRGNGYAPAWGSLVMMMMTVMCTTSQTDRNQWPILLCEQYNRLKCDEKMSVCSTLQVSDTVESRYAARSGLSAALNSTCDWRDGVIFRTEVTRLQPGILYTDLLYCCLL